LGGKLESLTGTQGGDPTVVPDELFQPPLEMVAPNLVGTAIGVAPVIPDCTSFFVKMPKAGLDSTKIIERQRPGVTSLVFSVG
jgi:hypothetical protein